MLTIDYEYFSGPMTVGDLAQLIGEKPVGVIKFLMTDLGIMAGINQSLDPATCVAVVEGFGMFVSNDDDDEDEWDDDGMKEE
jgi:translation initiation factor IF-2